MKVKRWHVVAVLIAAFMICCSCAKNASPGQPNAPQSGIDSAQAAVSGIPEVADPGNSLVPYEEGRQIYIGCENTQLDICFGETANITWGVTILSKEPIDTESFQILIPIRNQYQTYIIPWEYPRMTSYMMGSSDEADTVRTFSYDLYTVYCGLDYSEVRAMYEQFDADSHWNSEETARYNEKINEYLLPFQALTEADLPMFYYYEASVVFDISEPFTESFSEVDFVINGRTYHRQIGQINLIDGSLPYDYPIGGWGKIFISQPSNIYGDDIGRTNWLYDFVAEEDMTISNFKVLGDHTEILDLYMKITSGENTTDFYWDGRSPIHVYAGDQVQLNFTYRRPGLSNLHYNMQIYTEMDCILDGETKAWVAEINLVPNTYDPYLLYAIIFDGLDMESYFRDYYYALTPNRNWREAYQTQ